MSRKLTLSVDVTQHDRGDVDGEDVVAVRTVRGSARYRSRSHDHIRICEETDTGDQADPYVEPSVTGGEKSLEGRRQAVWTNAKGALSISARAALRCSSRST